MCHRDALLSAATTQPSSYWYSCDGYPFNILLQTVQKQPHESHIYALVHLHWKHNDIDHNCCNCCILVSQTLRVECVKFWERGSLHWIPKFFVTSRNDAPGWIWCANKSSHARHWSCLSYDNSTFKLLILLRLLSIYSLIANCAKSKNYISHISITHAKCNSCHTSIGSMVLLIVILAPPTPSFVSQNHRIRCEVNVSKFWRWSHYVVNLIFV